MPQQSFHVPGNDPIRGTRNPMEVYTVSVENKQDDTIPNGSFPYVSDSSFQGADLNVTSKECVNIERPVYTQVEFDEDFDGKPRKSKTIKDAIGYIKQACSCDSKCVKSTVLGTFPFIHIMKKYSIKRDLLNDVIAGIMVGIMNIPQGMAYAILAGLDPVYGLYVSFFPVLLYFFFGTSRHVSIGAVSIMSMMVAKSIDSTDCSFPGDSTSAPPSTLTTETGIDLFNTSVGPPGDEEEYESLCKLGVATALTFVAGAIQISMGFLQLGFVSVYMSEPLTRAITTGVSFHVLTSQISSVFGISVERYTGPGKLIFTYIDFFKKITDVVWATLIISIICLIVLYVFKEFINPRVKRKIKIPIPIDLLVVISATLASHYGELNSNYNVRIVGVIPTGIAPPRLPPTDRMPNLIGDAFLIAVLSFATTVVQAELFAKKHGYECDQNQELVALGICNLVPSFFNCYMTASALSRSLVQDGTGGRTQVASLVSCVLVLIVLFFIGPLFEDLPMCVLASIIIIALKSVFLRMKDLYTLWFISKVDWSIWFVTFTSTVFVDLDLGLLIGVGFSLITTIARTQRAYSCLLGNVPQTEIYKDLTLYEKAKDISGIKIFHFGAPLCYANHKHFINQLYTQSGVDPQKLNILRQKAKKKEREIPIAPIHSVIIDCTAVGYVDSVAVSTLKTVISDYRAVGVHVLLAACNGGVREMLVATKFYDKIDTRVLYPTVHDAVLASIQRFIRKEKVEEPLPVSLEVKYGSNEILLNTKL